MVYFIVFFRDSAELQWEPIERNTGYYDLTRLLNCRDNG
jgi:hypothetical protein